MKPVAEPLHHRAPHEDRPLQGVADGVADLPRDGGQQARLREDGTVARVHQQEAAGAVGVLHRSRLHTHLAEERRLLVAGDARDGYLVCEDGGRGARHLSAARHHLRHHRLRDVEELQQVFVPFQGVDVEEHRPRGVGHVGDMHVMACQARHQPAVDRAEAQLPLLGATPGPCHVVEDPFDFRGAEVGVDHEPRLLLYHPAVALLAEAVAVFRGAPVLPHDAVVDRLPGVGVPHDGGLALVGDADGGDVVAVDADLRDGLGHHRRLRAPDLVGVVLHPSRMRENLREFMLRHAAYVALMVEHYGAAAACALVER